MSQVSQVSLDDDSTLAFDCRQECFLNPAEGQDPPRIILVAIKQNGEIYTVCTTCIIDIIENPGLYLDQVLYGTHILSDRLQMELFPDDFVD